MTVRGALVMAMISSAVWSFVGCSLSTSGQWSADADDTMADTREGEAVGPEDRWFDDARPDVRDADAEADEPADDAADAMDAEAEADDAEGDAAAEVAPVCGNGIVEGVEECDDGNLVSIDDCLDTCTAASCGDGFIWAGHEACDLDPPQPCDTPCGTVGSRSCTGCAWAAECSVPAETCNGVDDNCDDATDEGLPGCNDTCANATDISVLTTVRGDTSAATDDNPACASACGGSTARDVWYRFTLGAREVVYLSLVGDAAWNTVIDLKRGSACGALTPQACQDDACGAAQSQWAGVLDAGTYYVVVDGCGTTDSGAFGLTWLHSSCPDAVAAAGPATFSGNSCGHGNDTNSDSAACGGSNSDDVPYFFALCPGSHSVHADDCEGESWAASVYIRHGGGGTCGGVAASCSGPGGCGFLDPRASTDATIAGPDLVFVVQDGWSVTGNSCGDYDLQVGW